MDVSYEKALPPEQWWQVLVNVSPGDLCSVMRTSSYMNSVASWPNLWAGMNFNMEKVREKGLAELYSIDRFKKVRKLNFRGEHFNFEQLQRVLHDIPASHFEDVNLEYVNFGQIPAELLANAVSHLKTVNLLHSLLTNEQCIQLLEVSLSSRNLVDVSLANVNLSGVPADLLARAVSRLQAVNLCSTRLTTEQCVQVLEVSLSSRSLVDVNLANVNLSGVPSDLLSGAVSRLQIVNLCYTHCTTEQCIQVLEASLSSRSLVDVNLANVNLSGVPADLLARAVSRLKTVNLYFTHLTIKQCIQVLEVSLFSRSLVDLNLADVNLSGVPADIIARKVSHLQTVNLWNTELTTEQCIQVLEASLSSRCLVDINLGHVNLSEVPSHLLAKAVSRLQNVNLWDTKLTTEQCIQVLEVSFSSRSLVDVNLGFVNLNGVPADLLVRAVSRLQTVNLQITNLTTEQCIQVVEASLSSKTLVNVDIHGNDNGLEGVPGDLLAQTGRNQSHRRLMIHA